ncbi:hypothetical protein BV25DRAFT_1833111 [Artomyces pyxidatus]|uniref:Uncharacterized protein n=1 Tax=Artomyces pyxidatus TaxID=48021 RepID=A0ACB8SI40_9AGAM|nr:hypothetical protein BV25DRAFT_1833111 [Artomyces pyxidatus]
MPRLSKLQSCLDAPCSSSSAPPALPPPPPPPCATPPLPSLPPAPSPSPAPAPPQSRRTLWITTAIHLCVYAAPSYKPVLRETA